MDHLRLLQEINATAQFNQWAGLEVRSAEKGQVELALRWKAELGQYSGFLHAGLIAGLIDTACGVGADLQIWRRSNVGFVLGVDYSGENIQGT